jgi:preprotein translocase subunit SecA
MLGRLVEQSQERVEGYNFDIRKHLLEYDDVLNDQRERIYKERDRVLVKESLEEDVLKMLESEITRRVPEALADPEGPWKLLAFLDEMQPTIFYAQQSERILSFTLTRIVDLLKEETGESLEPEPLKQAALRIARQALEAESSHLIVQTESFVQRTAESFNTQLAERMELLDIFLDNMEDYAGLPTRELSDLLFNQVRLKINLTSELAQNLIDRDEHALNAVRNDVESQLASIFLSRMVMTIERRLGVRIGLDVDTLSDKDWITIENAFCDAIEKIYTERIETLESPASQILQNIQSILKRQSDSGLIDLAELAAGMPQGLQAAIDPRTRQRVNRRVNLINYVFLAAKVLENKTDEEITAEVLVHLKNVQQGLQVIWGHMELQRLAQSDDPRNLLEWTYLENLSQILGKDQLKALSQKSLQEIIAEDDEDFIRAFGHQVQNVIYRHILLRAISDLWIEHLTQMEALRVSIRMEAYAQRDPLVQYKSQSTDRFSDLLTSIRMGVISQMFRLQPAQPRQPEPEARIEPKKDAPKQSSDDGKKKRKRHKKR